MKFRTEYKMRPASRLLEAERSVVLMGSCFSAEIGERMRSSLWRAAANPCGVLYNPASISTCVRLALSDDKARCEAAERSIVRRGELHCSWLSDSGVSAYERECVKERVLARLDALRHLLADAQALILTFGTAWVYELAAEPGRVVANCHKFPASSFSRRRMTVEEIAREWEETAALLREYNPGIRLIFTVSPVRHLKDGFEGNLRSKATLLLACEELCGRIDAEYFPAYELMTDDLRDYRFYASDLLHPSAEGADYVWEKFQECYLSESDRALLNEGRKMAAALAHRPIISDSSEAGRKAAEEYASAVRARYARFVAAHPQLLELEI